MTAAEMDAEADRAARARHGDELAAVRNPSRSEARRNRRQLSKMAVLCLARGTWARCCELDDQRKALNV